MRYGIFSDVHSNLEAFKVVYDYYKNKKIDKFIFLGDIIGYGANPRECIQLLQSISPALIAGNHDWAAANKLSLDYFSEYAKTAIIWTKNELSCEDIRYLSGFELRHEENNFICVHGSLQRPKDFNYICGINDARANFALLEKQLLFVGHSHKAQIYSLTKEGVFYHYEASIKINPEEKYIINVGSVGQPRDRDPRAGACIYDSDENVVILERLEYNIRKVADKILGCALPPILAERLFVGW
ncbi:MAG: metallophosphoesterase family protein [Candidatus Omnitrophota bacterium]|nr:metallophosphoesterase family protein [Candidatus Omnitrophota bacterium]